MSPEVFEILSAHFHGTIQDLGRVGWRRFGVPPGGAMDDHAARWANRLLDNPAAAPVLEMPVHAAQLGVRNDVWIAITGGNEAANHSAWRAVHVCKGETIRFSGEGTGVWTCVAVEGGFDAPLLLGSASAYVRGGLGRDLQCGDILRRAAAREFRLPEHVAGRIVPWNERRHYRKPPPLRVWRGPQWDDFGESARRKFLAQEWMVTSQSDRAGYRLSGQALEPPRGQLISEPVRVGTIQIPENGQPIVTLRDGPTVGGYPKLGLVDVADLSWLVQCGAGQTVRFQLAE